MDVSELGDDVVQRARNRLHRVQGQLRAVDRMLDDDADCEQLLRQIAAASKALRRIGVQIAVDGLERCTTGPSAASADGGTQATSSTQLTSDTRFTTDRERFRRAFLELS